MKKLSIALLSASLLLGACGSNSEPTEPVKKASENKEVSSSEPTQQELNEQLKKEAVKADFVELNVDNPPDGKKVYIDGEVSVLTEGVIDEFTITSEEEQGFGMYLVELINTTDIEYSEGDQVRVYGVVNGKDEIGMPKISATILEK